MKTSLLWLNDYLDRPVTPDEVERLMTDQGMPVETRVEVPGGDVMVDVEVTSNRADCLSHLGVAREVGAGSGRSLKFPVRDLTGFEKGPAVESLTSVTVDANAAELCPLYTARVIRGVKVGPSPAWLVQRLEAVGLRSINNVVDITNFVLMELGQPLHAFDMAKLSGQKIHVRLARDGEEFIAIDASKHKLSSRGMLVIADASRAVALAGIMGGKESEVDSATVDVLLESAVFTPGNVRRTSRALRLSSDSSYRFERGVDISGVERASQRAARLILEVAGGTLAKGVIRVGIAEPAPRLISLRPARCRQLLGIDLPLARIVELLTRLGLSPRVEGDTIACTCPSHRLDLSREVDLIEEVVRLEGLDKIGVDDRIKIDVRAAPPAVEARRRLAQALVAHGFHETINFTFVKPRHGEAFLAQGKGAVVIEDERRKAEPMLRPSVIPSLLICRRVNHDAGVQGVRLFETASVWVREPASPSGEKGEIIETRKLGLLADAVSASEGLRDLRGVIEEAVASLGGGAPRFEAAALPAYSVCARVFLGDQEVGVLGVVSPAALKAVEAQAGSPVIVAELELEPLLKLYPPARTLKPLARFPAIERDLSVVVDESVTWEQIASEVGGAKPALLEDVRFLVTYRGKPIEQGRKSVSFRMLFRDPTSTLRHEQVDGQVESVVSRLREKLGAELRA